ncbi:MAG: DUF4399 domain-containing protein [Anaerolineales bacterium]|nr:DUF4399 domain-containing protein [Anaerolineales bacterium]
MPRSLSLFALLLAGLAAACQGAAGAAARVRFSAPADGSTVSGPVHVTFAAESFTVEPAGEVKAGAGHLHIMVDTDCLTAGTVIPNDETHLHYGKAQLEAELDLAPGPHTLCLQAADGAHTALAGEGMTHVIEITVE